MRRSQRRSSDTDRQATQSERFVLDDHERSAFEFCRTLVNDGKEPRVDGLQAFGFAIER